MPGRRYWLRLLLLGASSLLVALVLVPVGLGWLMLSGPMLAPCVRHTDPSTYGLTYEDVAFPAPEGRVLRGYFLPGARRATVIIAPALSNDRGGDLDDAAVLNRAGFNVLTFDSRRCAGSGFTSLGYLEAADAEAAYRYLLTRPDVDPDRISIHGFSAGGSTSLFAAARIPQLRAVSAKGGYHDLAEQLGVGQHADPLQWLLRFGAEAGYRAATGLDIRALRPLSVIARISPRPLFLIYGSHEVSLPGARAMLQEANQTGGNATLWVVEGAGHGDYHAVAGEEYERRLAAFHRAALLGE